MAETIQKYSSANLDNVNKALIGLFETRKKDIAVMQLCLKELGAMVKNLGATWNVRPFGSAANGFSTRFSDLDATCFEEPPSGKTANDYIARVQPLLQEHTSFEVVEVISNARIPIIKMRFQDTLDLDLSFQNIEPLPNTQLLRAYAQLTPIVRHLGILIKLWAHAEGVCGAQNGHLSSYSIIIMVLYYLQVDEYVKMPCFPTWEFNGGKRLPDSAQISWTCPLKLSHLIARFFEFYATSHCWGYEVVSPRVGQRLYSNDTQFASLNGRDNSAMLLIEDPFLLQRNLNCVLGPTQQGLLYSKMSQAHADLACGKVPQGFLIAQDAYMARNRTLERTLAQTDVYSALQHSTGPIFDKKPTAHSDSQESTQSGVSANSQPSNSNRAYPRRIVADLPAPTPQEIPLTGLLRHRRFGDPSDGTPAKKVDDPTIDAELVDGTTWSL
jgi:hypothetical protein